MSAEGFAATETTIGGGAASGLATGGIRNEIDSSRLTTSARARHTSDEHASDNQRVRDDERRMRCAIVRSRAACLSWNALPPVGTHERSERNRSRTRCAPTMERSPPGGAFTHLVRLRSSSQQSPHPGARGLVLLTPDPSVQVLCRRPQREDKSDSGQKSTCATASVARPPSAVRGGVIVCRVAPG